MSAPQGGFPGRQECLPHDSHVALRELLRSNRTLAVCPVGYCRRPERVEWLLHAVTPAQEPLLAHTPRMQVRLLRDPGAFQVPLVRMGNEELVGELRLGVGRCVGQMQAVAFQGGEVRPFDELRVVGPGMPIVRVEPAVKALDERERWSRTIGALGESAWQRLRQLRVALVGCGRSGSTVASALAQMGVSRLTLIDADVLEPHNLGEMALVTTADLGKLKAQAIAETLGTRHTLDVEVCPQGIQDLSAVLRATAADVLISCVDNAAARLAVAILATLYLKPLLDIGTGILLDDSAWGADVRLQVPGRCLLCLGGVTDLEVGVRNLLNERPGPVANWRTQRAGSLFSLNGLAVHLGLRLFEEWLIGRRQESAWLHVTGTPTGSVRLEERTGQRECVLCERTGQGDEGMGEVRALLAEVAA